MMFLKIKFNPYDIVVTYSDIEACHRFNIKNVTPQKGRNKIH